MNVFHHLQKDKQRKQRHPWKLGKKRRESSERKYCIISQRVIIKQHHYQNQIANRDLKLKLIQVESIRKAKAKKEKVKTHTQVQKSDFRDSAKVKRLRQMGTEIV